MYMYSDYIPLVLRMIGVRSSPQSHQNIEYQFQRLVQVVLVLYTYEYYPMSIGQS